MIQILKVTKTDDQITVLGFDPSDPITQLVAEGWYSHTTNYYDPENYEEDGHLKPGATPREMSDKERDEYYLRLLTDKYAPEVSTATEEVLFTNPEAEAIVEQAIEQRAKDAAEALKIKLAEELDEGEGEVPVVEPEAV